MKNKVVQGFIALLLANSIAAQVPVREEPRHKVALVNDYIRLLDVRIQPGDTSLFHVHQIPSFFIPLSTTRIGSQMKGQGPRESSFPIDSTWYNGFENGPLIHRVWDDDTNVLHVIDLELLATKNSILPSNIELPLKIDFENDKLRVYKFRVEAGQFIPLPILKTPMLLICVDGAALQLKDLHKKNLNDVHPGTFQWLGPQQQVAISNSSNGSNRSILILLK
jgi:hypothetical protein